MNKTSPRLVRPLLGVTAFAAAMAVAFRMDLAVAELLAQPISSGQTKAVLRAMRCWGEGATLFFLVLGIASVQRHRVKHLAVVVFSVLICAGTVDLIKPLFGRHRPDQVFREADAHPDETGRNSSFPSGHTATAFSFASGLTTLYPPLKPVCLLAASGTALSRMYDGRHFLSDCIAGAAIGWFWGGWLVRRILRLFSLETEAPAPEQPVTRHRHTERKVARAGMPEVAEELAQVPTLG